MSFSSCLTLLECISPRVIIHQIKDIPLYIFSICDLLVSLMVYHYIFPFFLLICMMRMQWLSNTLYFTLLYFFFLISLQLLTLCDNVKGLYIASLSSPLRKENPLPTFLQNVKQPHFLTLGLRFVAILSYH